MSIPHLDVLVCPQSKEKLIEATPEAIEKLNTQIQSGSLQNKAGETITTPFEAGLLSDATPPVFYPIENGIPILLIDQGIEQ